jgi:hypothetical protein
MQESLESILKRIGGYVDQEVETPTGSDLTSRKDYVNRALFEWANSYDWDSLNQTYNFTISAVSTVSLALPTNFKKPMSALYDFVTNPPTEYAIVPKDERFTYQLNEEYSYLDGDDSDGYFLIVPKGLASGASIVMDIQVYPSALASLTQIPPMKNTDYLVQRAISLVLEARGDARYPIARAEADRILANSIEVQNAKNIGVNNQIPMPKSFVIGEP